MTRTRSRAAGRLIVALDYTALAPALRMARALRGLVRTVKIGSVLFTAAGPSVIRQVRRLGFDVMLDLKFHDIPSTVELSCRAAAQHGVSLLTVHGSGGADMLHAAVYGAREGAKAARVARARILAVTVLTSVQRAPAMQTTAHVLRLARAARDAGCDGVVASAQEAAILRRRLGHQLYLVCPGIRPASAELGDQRRVSTPGEALKRGADALVVGRPITAAREPRAEARRILDEMEDAC